MGDEIWRGRSRQLDRSVCRKQHKSVDSSGASRLKPHNKIKIREESYTRSYDHAHSGSCMFTNDRKICEELCTQCSQRELHVKRLVHVCPCTRNDWCQLLLSIWTSYFWAQQEEKVYHVILYLLLTCLPHHKKYHTGRDQITTEISYEFQELPEYEGATMSDNFFAGKHQNLLSFLLEKLPSPGTNLFVWKNNTRTCRL